MTTNITELPVGTLPVIEANEGCTVIYLGQDLRVTINTIDSTGRFEPGFLFTYDDSDRMVDALIEFARIADLEHFGERGGELYDFWNENNEGLKCVVYPIGEFEGNLHTFEGQ